VIFYWFVDIDGISGTTKKLAVQVEMVVQQIAFYVSPAPRMLGSYHSFFCQFINMVMRKQ
jgi:hypothetical protein